MTPVYINNIASIHAAGTVSEDSSLKAIEPDYKAVISNANLRRRMSRIVKMGVACGLECIGNINPVQIYSIITATGLGCLADTEKFMNSILDNDEQLLNPTAFIQSTFNTIGAQIALLLQSNAYNMTYVHRGLSFESALLDGIMRIHEGDENTLVGAIDELTPSSHIIQRRLGLLKDIIPGEGAHFFLLSPYKSQNTFATIEGVDTFIGTLSVEDITNRINLFLSNNQLCSSDIDWFVTGRNGNQQMDIIYQELEMNLFPDTLHGTFKDQCGEYHTATSYAVAMVAKKFKENENSFRYALIYNQSQGSNHSLILIGKDL